MSPVEKHGVETIRHGEKVLAVILRDDFRESGVHFVTPDDFTMQLAYMRHPKGKPIQPHVHRPVPREIQFTKETLIVKRGKLRVDFYDDQKVYLESRVLAAGDAILLATGGHGFEALEELEMFEVKQGPYAGELDKVRFSAVDAEALKVRE